jgi:hypothetical protein
MQPGGSVLVACGSSELPVAMSRQDAASTVEVLLPLTQALAEVDQPLTPYKQPQSSAPEAHGTGGEGGGAC